MRRSKRFRTVTKISQESELKPSPLGAQVLKISRSSSSESDSGRRLRPRNLLPEYCEDKLIRRSIQMSKCSTEPTTTTSTGDSGSKLKKPENHLIVVYKPSSNSDSSSFIPNRMRLLPSAALDKLHHELFPQKCLKSSDISLNSLSSNSQQVITSSNTSVGQTGLRRISSRRQQQLQQQQMSGGDHHFSTSSNNTSALVNGTNGRASVRPKLGSNLPRETKEPALQEMDLNTYARYLNLIPKDTYNQVPMVDLKKSWPLRNQCRTQVTTRSPNHHHPNHSQSNLRTDPVRLTSTSNPIGKPLQVINLKNGSFGSIPNSGAKQITSDLTRTELDRKQWLECIKTKETFVHSQKTPHVVIQQKPNGVLIMKPLLGSQVVSDHEVVGGCQPPSSSLNSSSRTKSPNMHEQFFKELNQLLPYTGPSSSIQSAEDRKLLSRFIQKYQLKPTTKCKLGLELTSSLGRRILEVYSSLTEIKSGIQLYRLVRLYEKYCSTNLSLHRDLLRTLKYTAGKFKIEFKIPSPVKQNCSTRLLRSCDVINKSTAAWGLNSYHLYTFSKQERLEKNLTLKTGLDWKARLMAIGCDRITGSQLFANSTIPIVKCTVCKGKINPDLGHSCGGASGTTTQIPTPPPTSTSTSTSASTVALAHGQRQSGRSTRTSSKLQSQVSSNPLPCSPASAMSILRSEMTTGQSLPIPTCGYTPIRSNVTAKTISAALASGSLAALICDTRNSFTDSRGRSSTPSLPVEAPSVSNGRMNLRTGPRQGQQHVAQRSVVHTNQVLNPLSKLIPNANDFKLMKLESESESMDDTATNQHEEDEDEDEEEDEEEELVLIGPSTGSRGSTSQISSNSPSTGHRSSGNFLASGNNGNIEVLIEF